MIAKTFGVLPLVAVAAFGIFALAPSTATATTLCPSGGTVGGFGETSSNVPGPLDGSCGAKSAVQIDIADSTTEGKLQFNSATSPYPPTSGFPTGLTLGGFSGGSASANVVFTGSGGQPYFALPFVDSSNSLGQGAATDQILLLEFQPNALSGNTLALDPTATLFNLYDNTTNTYLQGPNGQQNTKTLDVWLTEFAVLAGDQLQGIWVIEGLTGGNAGPDSMTVNSLTITSATPLPAALPMFGSALGLAGGYFGWRRKKKAAA